MAAIVQQVANVVKNPPSVWSSEVMHCMKDTPTCLDACCCYPCILAKQDFMMTNGVQGTNWKLCVCGTLLSYGTNGASLFFPALSIRGQLRGRYNIVGDPVKDGCVTFCCPFCTLAQQTREMAARGMWPGGICAKAPPPAA